MLSTVLKSDRAIQVNIQIVRIFTKMRKMLASHKEILHKLEKIEQKLSSHDNQILTIFKYLEQNKQKEQDQKNRERIGYKRKNEH